MNIQRTTALAVLATAILCPAGLFSAETSADDIAIARRAYSTDRDVFVAEQLQLTDEEGKAFWPLYREYRAEREKLGDSLVKLVLEYADVYPDVPEERAKQWLKDYLALEKTLLSERASYLKKFAKTLSPSKTLRFAQLESRMDVNLRLQLASAIPLAPISGELRGVTTRAGALAVGVPGGIVVRTHTVTATVTAIDQVARKLTLLSPEGIKQIVQVGPAAINFGQIRVGDRLNVTLAEQVVVYVAGEGEPSGDDGLQVVTLAPQGAKPSGVMAETTQVTAKVVGIDAVQHRATLEFSDGTIRTVDVRPDVDLAKRRIGDKVVIRMTETLALSVEKP